MDTVQSRKRSQPLYSLIHVADLAAGRMQVIDRANIRLDTLQRIVACLESSQAGLLAALTLTLDGSSWQHASDPKVRTAEMQLIF